MVHVTPEGTIYAFIAGSGLLKAEEPGFQWTPVSNDFGGALVLHLAAGKGDETQRRLYVVTFRSEEHTSELQSLMRISYAVFCLKKKKNTIISNTNQITRQNSTYAQ